MRAAIEMIGRDLSELLAIPVLGWVIVVLTVALPLVAGVALTRQRRALPAASLFIAVAVWGMWFLYYATDWWSNPGQGAWVPMFGAVLVGWSVLVASFRRRAGS